ncbi:hypothetical protein ACLGI4_15710 [Streptomyces sp. HMX112]|uniref:hypothetical protein n=1 Tax=Streptomyces sp. HMX112 TaxID=3390850 RepID=UPI003A809D6A
MRVAPPTATTVQDYVALAEIELCGELMIAASATDGERLSADLIDAVLKVSPGGGGQEGRGGHRASAPR